MSLLGAVGRLPCAGLTNVDRKRNQTAISTERRELTSAFTLGVPKWNTWSSSRNPCNTMAFGKAVLLKSIAAHWIPPNRRESGVAFLSVPRRPERSRVFYLPGFCPNF